MTDKQITNEIDISKCEFCEDSEYCYIYSGTADFKWMCKENEDCQIKNLLLQLKRKEQECQQAMDNYVQLDLQRVKEYNELVDLYKAKEQECERLKWYLKEIRDDELKTLDIELDEYETHCVDTEYSNIINLVEEALEEISPEDCRYKKDK